MSTREHAPPLITVVIPTYNRSNILAICLESLAQQTLTAAQYAVIIADNNSSDNTQEIAQRYAKKYNNFQYIVEKRLGVSNVKNSALRYIQSVYVVYLDDDAKVEPNWLTTAYKVITDHAPAIFGGPVYPYHLQKPPPWFKDVYGTFESVKKSGWYKDVYISESNTFMHTDIIRALNGFNTKLGVIGTSRRFHEGTEMVNTFYAQNKKIYFCTDLKIFHLINRKKYNPFYFLSISFAKGYDASRSQESQADSVWFNVREKLLLAHIKDQIQHIMKTIANIAEFNNNIQNATEAQQSTIEKCDKLFWKLGYLVAISQSKTSRYDKRKKKVKNNKPHSSAPKDSSIKNVARSKSDIAMYRPIPNRFLIDNTKLPLSQYIAYHAARLRKNYLIRIITNYLFHIFLEAKGAAQRIYGGNNDQ